MEIAIEAPPEPWLWSVLHPIGFSAPNDTTLGVEKPNLAISIDVS